MSKLNSPPPGTCALAGLFVSIVCAMVFGYGLALVAHKPDFKPYALVIEDDCYIDGEKLAPVSSISDLIQTEEEK